MSLTPTQFFISLFVAFLCARIVYEIICWILRRRFGIEFSEDMATVIATVTMLPVAIGIFLLLYRYFPSQG